MTWNNDVGDRKHSLTSSLYCFLVGCERINHRRPVVVPPQVGQRVDGVSASTIRVASSSLWPGVSHS